MVKFLRPTAWRRWVSLIDPALGLALFAATVLLSVGGWQIVQARDQALVEAEMGVATLSRALAQHAGRAIEAVDLTLVDAVERVEGGMDAAALRSSLLHRKTMLAQVRDVAIIRPDGSRVADAVPPHAPATSTDRAYFQWHRDHTSRDLHIDRLLIARTTGRLALPLSRRIDRADGSFGGVVVATLAPEFFEQFYRTVATGAQGAITLWTNDGQPLFRYPAVPEGAADVVSPNAVKAFERGSDTVQSHSPFDGIERRVAFERVEGLPLVVSASISTSDALASWSRSATLEGFVLAGAAIAVALLGVGLGAHRRRIAHLRNETRLADKRYRLLAENASDLITLKESFDGPRSYVSPSCCQILGWEPEELAVMPFRDTTHPDDLPELTRKFLGLTPASPEMTSNHRVRHKAGHYVWIEAAMTLTADGVLTALRDVTSRREAQRHLADSEARFRLLAEASSDMIQQLDLSGRRLYVSPASREIFGRTLSEMVGSHPAEFIVAEDAQRVTATIADLAAGRSDQARSIHQIRHAAGHTLYVEVQFRLVRDHDTGRPREIVSSVRDITERETLQRAHAEANRNLRLAEEIAHLGHWRVEQPSGLLIWSDEVFRIHGLDAAAFEAIVDRAIDLYHPDDRSEVESAMAAAIASRQPFRFSLRIVRPDGEIREVLSQGCCEIASDGSVSAVFGTIMDVTDLRAAERAATASEARYRLLADNATDMITQMSLDGQRLFVSPSSRDLLDYEPEELVGTNPFSAVHLDDASTLQGVLAELAGGQRDQGTVINRLRHKDGRWIWVETSLRPLRDGAGQTTGFVAAARDITDRKRALDALQASEARYRVLAEATTDVITQLDTSMRRQYVSPACRHLLGFKPEEMLGLRPSSSIHPDDADAVRALAAKVLAGEVEGGRVVTTYRTSHKLGHWVWVEAGINLISDPSTGAPVSLICSLRDVTVRQEAARLMDVARAAAEHAARVKADFVANMSHELRTPLTGILGVHDLLKRDPALGTAQRRLVDLASDAGSSLLAIVNDVLDFSKVEAGQLRLEAVPFDPDTLVASCRDLAAKGIGEKPVEIRTVLQGTLPDQLVGDPTRLRQVLLNLMTNAVKFTDQGSITVDVSYRPDESSLRVDVADTGVGIPPDRLETLFDRFTQADTSITRRYGGTGLGLAISKRLVDLMDGVIGVAPSAEGGARFWIEVPLPVHEGRVAQRQSLMAATPQSRRLLLAEDNPINAEIIGAMLSARGYDVVTVGDGAAAVAACEGSAAFDLCLMDFQMPVLDGLTATTTIRLRETESRARRLPIIGLTANVLAEDVARCLTAGMDAHAAKPVVWPDLFETIERLIANDRVAPCARTG